MNIVIQHHLLWVQLVAKGRECSPWLLSIFRRLWSEHQKLIIIQSRHDTVNGLALFGVVAVAMVATLDRLKHIEVNEMVILGFDLLRRHCILV